MAETAPSAGRLRAAMAVTPGAPFYRFETGWDGIERWRSEEGLASDADHAVLFGLDEAASLALGGLHPFEALLCPSFDAGVLEDRGDYELAQDAAGRVLVVERQAGRSVPEYVGFPVRTRRTWEDNVRWRLAPDAPGRAPDAGEGAAISSAQTRGLVMRLDVVGGYPFLRNLVGANYLHYLVYDEPDLVCEMMEAWLAVADSTSGRHQQAVALDEIVLHEDICFGAGPLISPGMIREFLLPFYERLLAEVKSRQPGVPLRVRLDSDGDIRPILPLYQSVGFDAVSPLEASAGCDPVEIGEAYPEWVLWGGIDRRLLACSAEKMDVELERILPAMKARGGYVPHIDHRVPAGVPLANYLHYRKRCLELGA